MDRDAEFRDPILEAGWWTGGFKEWWAMPREKREEVASHFTGCLFALPTWLPPVDCIHIKCRVRRGEVPPICIVNHALKAEKTNWLRWSMESPEGRKHVATIFRHVRKVARETQTWDAWAIGWRDIIWTAFYP